MTKTIFYHSMCTIIHKDNNYNVLIKMDNGKHCAARPFPATQEGLVAAMVLTLDVLTGKIMLMGEIDNGPDINPVPKQGATIILEAVKQIESTVNELKPAREL